MLLWMHLHNLNLWKNEEWKFEDLHTSHGPLWSIVRSSTYRRVCPLQLLPPTSHSEDNSAFATRLRGGGSAGIILSHNTNGVSRRNWRQCLRITTFHDRPVLNIHIDIKHRRFSTEKLEHQVDIGHFSQIDQTLILTVFNLRSAVCPHPKYVNSTHLHKQLWVFWVHRWWQYNFRPWNVFTIFTEMTTTASSCQHRLVWIGSKCK